MLRSLLGFGRRPGRQHQALPALERVQRSLQAMQRHAARLGVMVRLGCGQQLGEFEGAIDHRRVVAPEILGRSVRVVMDASDQAVHLQSGDEGPRLKHRQPVARPMRFRRGVVQTPGTLTHTPAVAPRADPAPGQLSNHAAASSRRPSCRSWQHGAPGRRAQ
jgi:hypothetical protein